MGGAIAVAHGIGGPTGALIEASAKSAFVDGLHLAVLVGAAVAFIGAGIAARWLPARAPAELARPTKEAEPELSSATLVEVEQ